MTAARRCTRTRQNRSHAATCRAVTTSTGMSASGAAYSHGEMMAPVIGLTRHATDEQLKEEADRIWREQWVQECTRNGDVDMDKVKALLAGYSNMMEVFSIVLDDITGGQMSKPNYNDTTQIISCIDENYAERAKDDAADALKNMLPGDGNTDVTGQLRQYVTDVCEALGIPLEMVFAE